MYLIDLNQDRLSLSDWINGLTQFILKTYRQELESNIWRSELDCHLTLRK